MLTVVLYLRVLPMYFSLTLPREIFKTISEKEERIDRKETEMIYENVEYFSFVMIL